MSGFVDIHAHVLPNLDDGSKSMQQTMNIIRLMAAEGITDVICTPHYYPKERNASTSNIDFQIDMLNKNLIAEGINLKLYSGNELYYRSCVPDLLEAHQVNTLAGSFFVLIEFNPGEEFGYIRNAVYELQSRGFTPILAHAERYCHVMSDMDKCRELVEMGAYIQVNGGSLLGLFGSEAKKSTKKLIQNQLVHFVATDTHDDKRRAPNLKKVAKVLTRKYGADYAEQLLCANPRKIINKLCTN